MTYEVITSKRFEKALKRCARRGLDLPKLSEAIGILARDGSLPPVYRPHKLTGAYKGLWECHIQPDWLLIWEQDDTELRLIFIDTGPHSDLF
ncbi:MAG: type II toxin-antitoxin system YafQ family toxin [Muribaculaceae bacterium]|nr:type II toxin-antitoxin system YafQ family toxin [Muribaculaceae bacterium]